MRERRAYGQGAQRRLPARLPARPAPSARVRAPRARGRAATCLSLVPSAVRPLSASRPAPRAAARPWRRTRRTAPSPAASAGTPRTYGEIWGDLGRSGEIWGPVRPRQRRRLQRVERRQLDDLARRAVLAQLWLAEDLLHRHLCHNDQLFGQRQGINSYMNEFTASPLPGRPALRSARRASSPRGGTRPTAAPCASCRLRSRRRRRRGCTARACRSRSCARP